MFWSELIDLLKKRYPPSAFRDPFREGPQIIEKIYRRLLGTTGWHFHNATDRLDLLRNASMVRQCDIKELFSWDLPELQAAPDGRYFLVLTDIPRGERFAVYDCQLAVLTELVQYGSPRTGEQQEFFIADKKYAWLLYIRIDHQTKEAKVYKRVRDSG